MKNGTSSYKVLSYTITVKKYYNRLLPLCIVTKLIKLFLYIDPARNRLKTNLREFKSDQKAFFK